MKHKRSTSVCFFLVEESVSLIIRVSVSLGGGPLISPSVAVGSSFDLDTPSTFDPLLRYFLVIDTNTPLPCRAPQSSGVAD